MTTVLTDRNALGSAASSVGYHTLHSVAQAGGSPSMTA
jgi:hypothetical protein